MRPLNKLRFIPRPRNSTEMRPSMPARNRWAFLNSLLFQSVLLGRLVSSTLRDRDLGDAALFAGLYILGAEEAAIGRAQFRRDAEGLLVTIQ